MPAINSGWKIFSKLAESKTGKSKLDALMPVFKPNRKGSPTVEVDADDFLDFMDELPLDVIPQTTRDKAYAYHMTGTYEFVSRQLVSEQFVLPPAAFETIPDGEPEQPVKATKKRGRPRRVKAEPESDE